MAYKLTPEQYKDVAQRRIANKNTAENTNSAVSAYARALNAHRALDNKNKQNTKVEETIQSKTVETSDDWTIRSLSTIVAPIIRFSEGVAKFFENSILDFSAGVAASVMELVGAEEDAKNVQSWAAQDIIGKAFDWEGIEQIYQNSWSNEWGSNFGELLQEGIYTVGQQAIPFALNFVPGAGAVLSKVAFAQGAYGGAFEIASQDGGSVLGANAYGLVSAAVETAIEGIGGAFKFGKGATVLDDFADKIVERLAKSEGARKFLGWATDAAVEGFEEVFSGAVQNYIQAMTYKADTSSVEAYFNNIFTADPATQEELWEQFFLGAFAGAVLSGAGKVVYSGSSTMQISESIQETEALREKGYNLSRRGKDTAKVEAQLVEDEQSLMEQVNAKFEQLAARRKDGNAEDSVLTYMESNFNVDENGKFISSKNGLVKAENVSYGVTEKDIQESVVGQGNAVHVGNIEGAAAETKSVIEKSIDNYNKVLGRKNHSSRLKLVFADIAQNQDGVRSYGYLSGNVVVIDVNALNENVEFQVFQEGKTKTYSANAAMSTLLHEVFHFTENTKAGSELRKTLIKHATNDADIIHAIVSGTQIEQGDNAAAEKAKQLAGADILTQTEKAYQGASENVIGSELSARQLENLLFNEKVIERLTEDNSTLAKRILNNAKRLLDALKGGKIAETKSLETLLGKTVKLYNKAIAQVGSGKYLTTRNQTQYSKRGYQPRDYSKITKEEYEHHAWATVNGVLSANESGLFMKKIGEKKLGSRFNQAADGSYMISVGENGIENKIVFTDGNWEAPSIEKVLQINSTNEDFLSEARRILYDSERRGIHCKTSELFKLYNSKDYGYVEWLQKGESGVQNNSLYSGEQNGNGVADEVRHSLRLTGKTDSNGRALTKEQAEFFKNSKAVDKNGNLQTVFHGTQGEFYTFDKNLRGEHTGARDAKLGFFFTSSKDVAQEYAVYAQDSTYFKKMHEIAKGDRDIMTWLGTLLNHEQRKNSKKYHELAVTQEVIDFVDLVEQSERMEHDIKELYLNIENPYERDWEGKPYKKGDMLRLVSKALQGDYDGVIIRNMDDSLDGGTWSDIFVVFEPNQIKDVTNKRPTASSDDIRYSRRLQKESAFEIKQDSELAERIKNSNKSKYTVIKEYLVEKFGGTEFSLSDGKKAIMDKSDAKELSHKADAARMAELTNLKDLVEKAILLKEIENAEHNKFDAFSYYGVKLEYAGKQFAIVINVGRGKNDSKYHIYAITNYNEKRAVEELKNSSSRPVGNAIKDGSFNTIIRNNSENVNTFDENSLNSGIKHSRRIVSNEGVSRSIDDALEMLSVLGNINEDTHRLEIGKNKLIDSYIARINDQASKGRLSVRSKVVNELVDSIFDMAIMTEYHDADYLTERVAIVDTLRKYFHSMNLASIKSDIQAEYGKTNNIFKLWGNAKSGRSWDTVVQEIIEEMPQLALEGDSSGMDTLYNIFNSYEKSVKELKVKKVQVSEFIKEADEVKRLMVQHLVSSLRENSTDLITKAEAEKQIFDLQNAIEDTFRAVKNGAKEISFRGDSLPAKAASQLRKIVEGIAKEHSEMYAEKRASEFVVRIKKDLTDGELREIKKTEVYKAIQSDIADRYLREHKEISFKSIEADSSRVIELKRVIDSVKTVHRLTDSSRETFKKLRGLDTKLLKKRFSEVANDNSHIAAIDGLQNAVKSLFKEASDGDSILISRNEMLSSDRLLNVVLAYENYLANETLTEDFKARGDFDSMQKKLADYKEYVKSISGMSYSDMPLADKLTFERATAAFIADCSRAMQPTTTITVKGASVSAVKYRDAALRKTYISLHKDKNGNYRGNRRAFGAFWAKYFQDSVRPFEAIALAENHAGGLLALFNEVREGYTKGDNARANLENIFLNFVKDEANKVGKKSYSDHLLRDEVEIQHSEGTFVVTKGELLGLYLTLVQEDGFMHADAANPLSEGIYLDNKNMQTNYRNDKPLKFTAENVASLEQHLSETDIQFIEVVREFFKKAGELKGSVDMQLYGMERLLGELYYPLQTDESARDSKLGDKVSFYDALDPSGHLSINQSRTSGVKALRVRNIADLMTSYAKSIGLYYGVAVPVADMRMVYSSKGVYGESIKDCISKYSTKEFDGYLDKLLLDVQGAMKVEDSFLERQRQRYATYAIAANIKSPIKALGGIFSLWGRLKTTPFLKGVVTAPFKLIKSGRVDFSQMYEYCPATRMRYRDRQATMAAMNVEGMSRVKNSIVDKLAIGIELVDKYTIYVAWNAAKAEAGAVGENANNPELLRKAGVILNEAMDTTDRFEMTERNAYSRSSDALHRGFSMFTSASQAQLTQAVDKLSTQAQLYHLKKQLPDYIREAEANRDKYSKQLERAQETLSKAQSSGDADSIRTAEREVRKINAMLRDATLQVDELYHRQNTIDKDIKVASTFTAKMLVSISSAIIVSAALSRLMDNLMGDKDEEEVGVEFLEGMLDESIANVFSMFPIFGQLYNAIDGFGNFEKKSYDMSFWLIDEWNGLADAFNTLAAFVDGTGNKTPLRVAYEVLNAIGMWTGIPIRNLYNTVSTFLKVDAKTSYEFQNAFSKGTYGSDLKKAIDAGDAELAETITRLMMKDTFGDTDTKVVSTVRSLYEQGYSSVIPKTVSKSVTVDGITYEMTSKQQQAFKKIYSQADTAIERLIGKQSFVNLSPKVQADAIKWIYDYYYDRAKENLSGIEDDSRKALFGSYINIDTLAVAYSYCRALEADTDKNGKTINGTRKAKVVKYLSSLKTSAAEKYMILGYLGYAPVNESAKTLITNFARKNGASKAEIAELLEECNIAA